MTIGKKKIVLTGATGFIGRSVARELIQHDYELIVFSRNPMDAAQKVPGAAQYIGWQAEENGPWMQAIDGSYAVIHCAAPSIWSQRYTPQTAKVMLENRIISTRGLVNAMKRAKRRPLVFISSASVGIYGYHTINAELVDETTPPADDNWGIESLPWEKEALMAEALGIRTVIMRTSYVLGADGGGLPYQVQAARKDRGGVSRPSNAYCPWIHIHDEARLYLFALEEKQLRGPLNCTSPNPVTNREFASYLSQAVAKPVRLAPYFILRLMVGKVAEIYARGRRVIPRKALELGFTFEYPVLNKAFSDLVPQILSLSGSTPGNR